MRYLLVSGRNCATKIAIMLIVCIFKTNNCILFFQCKVGTNPLESANFLRGIQKELDVTDTLIVDPNTCTYNDT